MHGIASAGMTGHQIISSARSFRCSNTLSVAKRYWMTSIGFNTVSIFASLWIESGAASSDESGAPVERQQMQVKVEGADATTSGGTITLDYPVLTDRNDLMPDWVINPGTGDVLGAVGVAHRRKLAAIGAGIAIAGLVAIDLADVTFRWRALLFIPVWFAALCWFQGAAKT